MKKIFLIILLLLTVLNCSFQTSIFILDNPTDTEINVKVDGKEYKLASGGYEKITLKPGKHSLVDNGGKEAFFIVYADSTGGILNPTRSSYIYVSMAYAVEGAGDSFRPMEKDKSAETSAVEYKIPPFKNPEIKKYAEEMSALDKAYAAATEGKEQKRIMAEYKKAWKNYVQASMDDNSDLELLGELKFNNLGRGVLIIEK